jgi:hypothetical protein
MVEELEAKEQVCVNRISMARKEQVEVCASHLEELEHLVEQLREENVYSKSELQSIKDELERKKELVKRGENCIEPLRNLQAELERKNLMFDEQLKTATDEAKSVLNGCSLQVVLAKQAEQKAIEQYTNCNREFLEQKSLLEKLTNDLKGLTQANQRNIPDAPPLEIPSLGLGIPVAPPLVEIPIAPSMATSTPTELLTSIREGISLRSPSKNTSQSGRDKLLEAVREGTKLRSPCPKGTKRVASGKCEEEKAEQAIPSMFDLLKNRMGTVRQAVEDDTEDDYFE